LSSPDDAEIFLGTKIVPARHASAHDARITRTFIGRESVEKSTRLQAAPQRWQQVGGSRTRCMTGGCLMAFDDLGDCNSDICGGVFSV
jgi:hypothetical protein